MTKANWILIKSVTVMFEDSGLILFVLVGYSVLESVVLLNVNIEH